MENIKRSRGLFLSVLILSGLFFAYTTSTTMTGSVDSAEPYRPFTLSDLVTHSPIIITDNANFSTLGFLGSGIEGNPYIIDNLSIISDEICINITDTTAHFVIRNSYLAGNTTANNQGILFSNVVNGTIEDCTITWRNYGVSIVGSNDIVIDNVEISNTSLHGILLSSSSYYCNVTNSYIHDLAAAAYGIYDDSNYPYFYNCTITGAKYGFNLIGSTPVVESCTINDNDVYGIYMQTTYPTILNSSIRRNGGTGIYSYLGGNRQIHNNTVSHNGGTGIYLRYSMGSNVTGNAIYKNGNYGIYLEGLTQNNHFFNNSIGWQSTNAWDYTGRPNYFDDEVSLGNAWSDYSGTGVYAPAGAMLDDNYPTKLEDTQSPTGFPATNITFGQGTTGNMITWSAYDKWPNTYTLYLNGNPSVTGWLGGPIEISFDHLTEGLYNVTMVVSDCGGDTISDTVYADVYLFDLEPQADDSFESGTTGHWINWSTRCAFPTSYEIQVDGGVDDSGVWYGEDIYFSTDHLQLGNYVVTLILTNSTSDQMFDYVDVTVYDTIEPSIEDLGYYVYELGFPRTISWLASDTNPTSFDIMKNGSTLHDGIWIGGEIQIFVQNMETGLFNYTLILADAADNVAVDTLLVLVCDTISPTVTHPEDMVVEVSDPNESIIWSIQDYSNGTYVILVDEEEYESGYFETGDIEISTALFSSGIYNVTLLATDESGNSASDTVWLDVTENLAPTVIGPSHVEMTEGQLGVWVQWNCSDSSPDGYSIMINDTIVESGNWEGYDIFYALTNLPAGQHNITLTVWDTQGLESSDTVEVTVLPITITTTTTTETSTTTTETTTTTSYTLPDDVEAQLEVLRYSLILVGAIAAISAVVSIGILVQSRRSP